ncbi:MAG: peptidoglycan editing factor PgeF [Thermoanaerobaculia bacterium]
MRETPGWTIVDGRPESRAGVTGVRSREDDVEVLFLGKGTAAERARAIPAAWVQPNEERSWLRQVHGDRSIEARPGSCGEADALVTAERGLWLEIATADCVPVLLAGGGRVAAAHAGWRGIAAGIVAVAVRSLGASATAVAWIGPAIGPCCYEVGDDVARQVVAASSAVISHTGSRSRPHLDLQRAVAVQLLEAGVREIRVVRRCTSCEVDWLWSYRRDGANAGRNLSLIRLSS